MSQDFFHKLGSFAFFKIKSLDVHRTIRYIFYIRINYARRYKVWNIYLWVVFSTVDVTIETYQTYNYELNKRMLETN